MIHTNWSIKILDALMLTGGGQTGNDEKQQEKSKLGSATFQYDGKSYEQLNLLTIGTTNAVVEAIIKAANDYIATTSHGDSLTESQFNEYNDASDKNIYSSQTTAESAVKTVASNKKSELLTTIKDGVTQEWLSNNKLTWYKMVDDDPFVEDAALGYRTDEVIWYEKIKDDNLSTPTSTKYKYVKRTAEEGISLKTNYFTGMQGWTFKADKQRVYDYPKFSYIGLFTEMPEPDGSGYQEPPSTSTYQRMDLLNDVILGRGCLSDPIPHTAGGAESTNDTVQILFPEAYVDVDHEAWGTIKGFGVFETDAQDDGVTPPIFWDKLANDTELEIESGYVPLFRTGDFKVILQ